MPNLGSWLADNRFGPITAMDRAVLAWRRIQDRAVSIVVYRAGVAQAAQTVRIEYETRNSANEAQTDMSEASKRQMMVFGIVDHPTLTATSLVNGDRFVHEGHNYEIMDVVKLPGEIQARAERIS